jgi:hypothetical protein
MLSAYRAGANIMGDKEHGHPHTHTPKPSSPSEGKQASGSGSGDGQQGTGGIASGEATSTPRQHGSQPHLGSQPGHVGSAPSGSGENEGANEDRVGIPAGPDEIDAVGGARKR